MESSLKQEKSEQKQSIDERNTLKDHVKNTVTHYFSTLEGATPENLYDMILEEIERPLLDAVMKYTKKNQSKTAIMLGISRGTLRKKLKQYGFLGEEAGEEKS